MRKHVFCFAARTKIRNENDEENGLVSKSVFRADLGRENDGLGGGVGCVFEG